MKLLNSVLVLFALTGATVVQANDEIFRDRGRDAGREAAVRVCDQVAFQTERRACMDFVSSTAHFEVDAVNVCRQIRFDSNVTPCLRAIADKEYLKAELSLCSREAFDNNRVSCLDRAGRRLRSPPACDNEWIRKEVEDAVYFLNTRNPERARRVLLGLMDEMDRRDGRRGPPRRP